MRLRFFCPILVASQLATAQAAPDLCQSVARGVEASLRAFSPSGKGATLSIRNAVKKRPAAGLDLGADIDDEALRKFPMDVNDRALFQQSVRRIFRAGGATGLAMLDAEAGAAPCHAPFLFSLAGREPKPVARPAADDQSDLCAHGGVMLGAVGGAPFYVQSYDDQLDVDRLQVFTLAGGKLTRACVIESHYSISNQVVEKACGKPDLCAVFAGRITQWAQKFHDGKGKIADIALTPSHPRALPGEDDPAAFPTLDAGPSRIVPQAFRYDGKEAWFALRGEAADAVRVGAAARGSADTADWDSFTLVALYKAGQPVASFVVERKRRALLSLSVRTAPQTAP